MNTKLSALHPQLLWSNFEALTQIPRTSGNEKEVIDFIDTYAKNLGLETLRTEIGNLIIRCPATPGMEDRQGVVLQGHCDMVGQKDPTSKHNFLTDPIEPYIDGNYVRAQGTTLGADDGIGIATALAVLADKTVAHGPLEILITVDEERTMAGATNLLPNEIRGKILLNLDSEQEGEIVVGCAGGMNVRAIFKYTEIETAEEDIAFKVKISGLKGGHSGIDIHLPRANANKLLARFLKFSGANYESMLAEIAGGNMHNAIPREAFAVLTIDTEDRDDFIDAVDEFEEIFRNEYPLENDLKFTAEQVETPKTVFDEMTTDDMINALQGCPNGIIHLSSSVEGAVETSSNLSVVKSENGQIEVIFLVRSAIESAKEDVASSLESIFRLSGAQVEIFGDYAGWRPNTESKILQTVLTSYRKLFSTDAQVVTMHAGLECGIIGNIIDGMDMVSFGPTIKHPHSPSECVEISSVEKFWKLLVDILQNVPSRSTD